MSSISSAQKTYEADILLDKTIYNPGDFVSGQAILKLARKLCCDTVTVQLHGSVRVFFIQKITKPGALCQSKAFEQEQILIDQTVTPWLTSNQNVQKRLSIDEIARRASSTAIRLPRNTDDNLPGLEQGTRSFNFSFPLPQTGLYTSFDAKNSAGYIRYYILLKVLNGSCVVLRKKLLFPVVCPTIIVNYPLSSADKIIVERKDFEKGSYLTVHLEIDKRVFVPGEPITGYVSIENKSGKSVKFASLYINQETICYATRPEIQMHESSFQTPGMGLTVDKLRTGEDLKYPIKFNVPALLPNIDVPNCIQTFYHIHLDVNFIRNCAKGAPIRIRVPISIATHLQFPERISAPPAYDDIIENRENIGSSNHFNLPPPDYNSSVLGLSSIDNEDANYAPRCYHYNFGFLSDENADDKKNQ